MTPTETPAETRTETPAGTLCDTGPLIALLDRDDIQHARCLAALPTLASPLLTTWSCLTEAMHFLGKAHGWDAQAGLWQFIRRGVLQLHMPSSPEELRIEALMEQYRDAPMDLADASLVAAAETLNQRRVFTLDKHFHAYRIHDQHAFEIVS